MKSFLRTETLLIAGTVLFAFFCFSSINKPLTTDEVEFASAGLAIARTGKPIYYMGDTPEQYIPTKDLWQVREAPQPNFKYGLWHAPLYIGVLALSLKIFGMSNWAARLPGVACMLATLWLLRGIVKLLFPREKAKPVFNVVAFLYLINPLILQQCLMLDVDNTVVTVTSVLFLHEFLRLEHRQIAWLPKYAWLSLLIALTFWAKEFAGLFVGTALLIYVVGNRRWRDAFGVVLMLLAGMALFWGSWWLYCRLSGMPVMYFIRFTILGKLAIGEGLFTTIAKQSGLGNALFFVLFGCLHTTLWVSIFYVALFLVTLGWRVKTVWQTKRLVPLDLLMLYVLVMLAATQGYRPSGWFLKYEYPALGVLLVPIAAYLCEKFSTLSRGELYLAGVVALILAAAQVILIQDPVLAFFTMGLKGLRDKNIAMFYAIITVVILAIIGLSRVRWPFSKVCAGTMVICLVGVNLGIDWKQRASYTTSISWNNYGETGFAETVAYLKSVLRSNEVPICRKDFGFYLCEDAVPAKHSWYNPAVITDVKTSSELVQNITAQNVSHIVLDRYSIRPDAVQIIQKFYELDKQIGSYYILRRK